MLKAFVHTVSPEITRCELTHKKRVAIDPQIAVEQHKRYCETLQELGAEIITLSDNLSYPDSVFVEDSAVILDEVAVICRPGIAARRGEEQAIATELARHRSIEVIQAPATLEGGDVLQMGNTLFVGKTSRTNEAGINAFKEIADVFDYNLVSVEVEDCLHLKTACTALSGRSLLVNPAWVDIAALSEFNVITVDETEPWAANVLCIGQTVCVAEEFPETAAMLRDLDFKVRTIDISELSKAEAGLTCLSLLFNA